MQALTRIYKNMQALTCIYMNIHAHTSTYKHIHEHTTHTITYKHIHENTRTYKHIQTHTSTFMNIQAHTQKWLTLAMLLMKQPAILFNRLHKTWTRTADRLYIEIKFVDILSHTSKLIQEQWYFCMTYHKNWTVSQVKEFPLVYSCFALSFLVFVIELQVTFAVSLVLFLSFSFVVLWNFHKVPQNAHLYLWVAETQNNVL